MTKRILIWTQHLLGTGHFMRARLVAEALRDAGYDITLVTGGIIPPGMQLEGIKLVRLPAVRAKNELFDELVDEHGQGVTPALLAARKKRLVAEYSSFKPNAVITETFPFGRRLVQDELLALICAIGTERRRPKLLASVRDVLQRPRKTERARAMTDFALRHYTGILVHSDPTVMRVETGFGELSEVQHLLHYTGYVCNQLESGEVTRSEVIVSAGGGAVGDALISVALEAKKHTGLRQVPWTFVAGPNGKVLNATAEGIMIVRSLPDFQMRLSRAMLSISQAGYNTICETLSARTPCVVVPFETDREREQTSRSLRLEEMGLVSVVRQAELNPHRLAEVIDRAAQKGMPSHAINLDGKRGTVAAVAALLG